MSSLHAKKVNYFKGFTLQANVHLVAVEERQLGMQVKGDTIDCRRLQRQNDGLYRKKVTKHFTPEPRLPWRKLKITQYRSFCRHVFLIDSKNSVVF